MSSAPRLAPSRVNWTPTTPTSSEALALTGMVPETLAPGAGAETATVGGESGGGWLASRCTILATEGTPSLLSRKSM